jgi:hypothetical protein
MNVYLRNKNCRCVRCQSHGMMAPAILVTIGVLWLLDNYSVILFGRSFPVLFLVIGAVLLITRAGSTEGHLDPPSYTAAVPLSPPPPPTWSAGAAPPPDSSTEPNDSQVRP